MHANHLLLLIIAIVVASGSALGAPQPPEQSDRVDLFDFLKYKQLFGKTYANILEEATRAKYFTARALRAFVSAISFKFRRETYYLSVNQLSDHSPAELDMMENHLLGDLVSGPTKESKSIEDESNVMLQDSLDQDEGNLPEFMPELHEDLTGELHELLEAHRGEPGYVELEQVLESNSSAASVDKLEQPAASSLPLRELPLSKLINTGADAKLAPETQAKVVAYVPSDNPLYEGIELETRGLVDQQLPVSWFELDPPRATNPIEQLGRFLGGVGENIVRTLNPEFAKQQDEAKRRRAEEEAAAARAKQTTTTTTTTDDEVFVDLRQTNCLFLPRHQGRCGSCYAFAAITMMEFLRCRETGKLVALSEQYMVDCGAPFVERLGGCQGGSPTALPVFVRNFGLHLRAHYPYRAREEQCPYDADTDPKRTGYLRPHDFSSSVSVPIELWPEALKHGPLLVAIATGPAFKEFGGGVYSGKQCPPKATHAVLVVGHGRADSREYWLVRNSHGTGWGEQGHMRLDKQSDCIHPAVGFALGVRDPKLFNQVHFAENKQHELEYSMLKPSKAEQIKGQFKNQAHGFGQKNV